MNTNETKVDVLAVMDDAFTFCAGQNSGPTENEMRQARAAVAELIEAAKATLVFRAQSHRDRLETALARIGGAA